MHRSDFPLATIYIYTYIYIVAASAAERRRVENRDEGRKNVNRVEDAKKNSAKQRKLFALAGVRKSSTTATRRGAVGEKSEMRTPADLSVSPSLFFNL